VRFLRGPFAILLARMAVFPQRTLRMLAAVWQVELVFRHVDAAQRTFDYLDVSPSYGRRGSDERAVTMRARGLCSGKSLCWALHGNGVHFVSPNRLLKCSRRIALFS
jgi:hypothetical protein